LDSKILAEEGREIGFNGTHYMDVKLAYKSALNDARPQDLIYVGGSTFVVADLLKHLGE
jgi:dihydrofolate synthase/folylpolyglutamate synthase